MKKNELALLASLSVFACGIGYLLLTADRSAKKKLPAASSTPLPDESRIRDVMHKSKEHVVGEHNQPAPSLG